MLRPRVILALARTPRQSLARQVRQYAALTRISIDRRSRRVPIDRLVSNCADVASIVGVRPHAVSRSAIPSPSEVAHHPYRGPEASNVAHARELNARFDISSCEAKFVPTRDHASLVVQVVCLLLLEGDDKTTPLRGDCLRVIPLQVVRRPVVQVDRFPERVVSRVECPVVRVELVGEDKLVRL